MSKTALGLNLVIDPKAVIDGFCWAYCKALADELERLLKTGEVWYTPDQMSLSDQGELIVRRLRGQILRTVPPPDVPLNDDASEELALIDLLTEARKFLAVFEKK